MPRVKLPDGRVLAFPDGMAQSDMEEALSNVPPAAPTPQPVAATPASAPAEKSGPLFSSPKGFYGPGVLANLKARYPGSSLPAFQALYDLAGQADVRAGIKSPLTAQKRAGQYAEATGGTALAMAAPNPASVLGRASIQGGVSSLQSAGRGDSPLEVAEQGGIGGALNLILSGLGAPGKLLANQLSANRAQVGVEAGKRAYEQSVKDIRAKYAEDLRTGRAAHAQDKQRATAEHEALTAKQEAEHAGKVRSNAERSAASIAQDFKSAVPAWKDFPSDERGLISMLYGRGPKMVSKEFDKAMKDVITRGQGKDLILRVEDAHALGLDTKKLIDTGATGGGTLKQAVVDAGEAASAAIGKWRKNPSMYRRVVEALDKAGVGDPAARQMYKAAHGLMDYADKSGMVRYDRDLSRYVFDAEKALEGATNRKTLGALSGRGLGDIESGIPRMAIGGPLKPEPPAKRAVPPYVAPPKPQMPAPPPQSVGELPGYKVRKNPLAGHPFISGAIAEAPFAASGHHGLGIPFALGAAGAEIMPKQFVTKAPLDPKLIEILTRSPGLLNAIMRAVMQPGQNEPR